MGARSWLAVAVVAAGAAACGPPPPERALTPPTDPITYVQRFDLEPAAEHHMFVRVEQTVRVTHTPPDAAVEVLDVAVWVIDAEGPPNFRSSDPPPDPNEELLLSAIVAETWGFMADVRLEVTLDQTGRVERVAGLDAAHEAIEGERDPQFYAAILEGALSQPSLLFAPLGAEPSTLHLPAPLWGPRLDVATTWAWSEAVDGVARAAIEGTVEIVRETSPVAHAERLTYRHSKHGPKLDARTERLTRAVLESGSLEGSAEIDAATGVPIAIAWQLTATVGFGPGDRDHVRLAYSLRRAPE